MRLVSCTLAFLLLTFAFSQQLPQSPSTQPPQMTPPTFPEGQDMPPDTKAPAPRELSRTEVQQQIDDHLKAEPALATAQLTAQADRHFVVLSGVVDDETQRDLALRIAESYAGNRKVIDKIKIRQQT